MVKKWSTLQLMEVNVQRRFAGQLVRGQQRNFTRKCVALDPKTGATAVHLYVQECNEVIC